MNSIPLFGVLVLNRADLLLRLFESIDYSIDEIVIVNNSTKPDVAEAIEKIKINFPQTTVYTPGHNMGVGPGWNWIYKSFDKPWYLIAGSDVQFTPGDLEKMAAAAWDEHLNYGHIYGNLEMNAFVTTKLNLEVVGYFDENFYPAYLEDCDMKWRMKVLKIGTLVIGGTNIIHGEAPTWGSHTIYSDKRLKFLNSITHQNGWNYYERKWGGQNDREIFSTPFNNPKIHPKEWIFDPELRKLNDIWGV